MKLVEVIFKGRDKFSKSSSKALRGYFGNFFKKSDTYSFLKINERCMESLKNFQIQLNGGIEREYFRKKPFNEYKSEYFSSER